MSSVDAATEAGSITIEDNNLYVGDCRDLLTEMESESVQLAVTSPPYNIDKDYGAGYDDGGPIEQWRYMMADVMEEVFRILKPDGKFVINVGKSFADSDEHGRFCFFPLAAWIKTMAYDIGYDFWDEAIWNKRGFASRGGGALMGSYPDPTNMMITQTHEHIIVLRKWVSESYFRGRELPEVGSNQREESKVTKEKWREYTQSVWEYGGVRQSDLDVDHGAVFPEETPKRAVQLYSFKDQTVLDPFMGTGTTAVAAKKAGRNYIGFDQSAEYIEHARNRVDEVEFDAYPMKRE